MNDFDYTSPRRNGNNKKSEVNTSFNLALTTRFGQQNRHSRDFHEKQKNNEAPDKYPLSRPVWPPRPEKYGKPAQKALRESSSRVTGPWLTRETSIIAWNSPVATVTPWQRTDATNSS